MADIMYCRAKANFGQMRMTGSWQRVSKMPQQCIDGALDTAETIASYSKIAVKAAKEVVDKSQDSGVREGMEFENRIFMASLEMRLENLVSRRLQRRRSPCGNTDSRGTMAREAQIAYRITMKCQGFQM